MLLIQTFVKVFRKWTEKRDGSIIIAQFFCPIFCIGMIWAILRIVGKIMFLCNHYTVFASNGAIISLAIIMNFKGIPSGPLLFARLGCLI